MRKLRITSAIGYVVFLLTTLNVTATVDIHMPQTAPICLIA